MSSPSAQFLRKSSSARLKIATRLERRSTISLPVPSFWGSLKLATSIIPLRSFASASFAIMTLIFSPISLARFRPLATFELGHHRTAAVDPVATFELATSNGRSSTHVCHRAASEPFPKADVRRAASPAGLRPSRSLHRSSLCSKADVRSAAVIGHHGPIG